MIVIIDYSLGNPGSIKNMIKKIGYNSIITNNIKEIKTAKRIILPGVGAFDNGMQKLRKLNLIQALNNKILIERVPFLGICLGMQLITNSSEEGNKQGLNWINAKTIKFKFNTQETGLRIPHIGWNTVQPRDSILLKSDEKELRFYFVHSFHILSEDNSIIKGITNYGYNFISVIEKDNIYATQFHPEKSHKFGMQVLKNFIELC